MPHTAREALLARADVPDEDIDDIIGIAAELQEAERAGAEGATVAEVQAVAAELDVAPEHVERAIAVLRERREEALDRDRKAELQARERRRRRVIAGGTVLAVLAVLIGGQVLVARATADDLRAAAANVEHTASYVDVVLDRQAALVPQLVALAGGDPSSLDALVQQLQEAPDLDARLDASRALDRALAKVLADLPPPRDDTEGIQRLGLQHEIAGVQNRRSTELRRLEDARRTWATSRAQPGAGLALRLGLVRVPPGVEG